MSNLAHTVKRTVLLDAEPAEVWEALTDEVLLSEWLLPVTGLKLEPGAPFTLKTQPYPGWDGTVNCRVVEIETHKKVSYKWDVGDMHIDTAGAICASQHGRARKSEACREGQRSEPYEQNTQQSPVFGLSIAWQCSHSYAH